MTVTCHVTLTAQIAEADREVARRSTVYPGKVANDLMTQEKADQEIANMVAIRDSLVAIKRASEVFAELKQVLEEVRS
jgi:hypothetical protein